MKTELTENLHTVVFTDDEAIQIWLSVNDSGPTMRACLSPDMVETLISSLQGAVDAQRAQAKRAGKASRLPFEAAGGRKCPSCKKKLLAPGKEYCSKDCYRKRNKT